MSKALWAFTAKAYAMFRDATRCLNCTMVSGLAYVIYYFIVENLGAVAAAGVTYIPPVVALAIGVVLAGDVVHPLGYVATVLILSGVALLQYGRRLP